ncbi:Immunoglobulin domain containing protein 5, partial [Sarcoptes scabiei]
FEQRSHNYLESAIRSSRSIDSIRSRHNKFEKTSYDRWHTVSAFVGSEISIPCSVDLNGCGNIYFITWTKNVSNHNPLNSSNIVREDHPNRSSTIAIDRSEISESSLNHAKTDEWQRVFIHSKTFERVLGDLDTYGPKNRVRFGPQNLSSAEFAFLTLSTVVPEDEGVYKCDVTYVTPHAQGKCPSLTYIRVQTLIRPSPPSIRVNGKSLSEYHVHATEFALTGTRSSAKSNHFESSDVDLLIGRQIGPFEEGSTIVFECSTFVGRPMPELHWFNGSRLLRSKLSTIDLDDNQIEYQSINTSKAIRRKLIATARIIASRYDLGSKFECRVNWNNSQSDNGWNESLKSLDSSHLKDWLFLDIKVRPLSIRVESSQNSVMSGEKVQLRCVVDGARPAANITWYNRTEIISSDNFLSDETSKSNALYASESVESKASVSDKTHPINITFDSELMTDGTYQTTSVLVFTATRSDHLADFVCEGTSEVLKNRNEVPLLQGITLNVFYPPIVAIEPYGMIAINESSTIQFWCTYDANPMNITRIVWFKNNHPIETSDEPSEANKITQSRDEKGTPILTIREINRQDTADYSCQVENRFKASDSITVARLEVACKLFNPPVVSFEIIDPKNGTIEERLDNISNFSVTFKCSLLMGNPSKLLAVNWYKDQRIFLTTISLKNNHNKFFDGVWLSQSSSMDRRNSYPPSYHRIGSGKHFTLTDDSTIFIGPLDGKALFIDNELDSNDIYYLDDPQTLTIANVTRKMMGNYGCSGYNGAANYSDVSDPKFLSVKC